MEKLKFFKTRNVQSPERGTELSAGVDMYIPVDLSLNELSAIQPIKGQVEVKVNPTTGMLQEFTLMPQRRVLIPSGIKVKFPKGYCGLLVDKSGVASKVGITLLAKLIDEDYQGEIHFNLVNTSDMAVKFRPGQKITQMVVMPVSYCQPEEVSTIDELYAGENQGETDIVLKTEEPFPFKVSVMTDNAGRESTGKNRVGAMVTYDSLLGLRDKLSLG